MIKNLQEEFDNVVRSMEIWRNEDHSDITMISRNNVITILEGIKRLKEDRDDFKQNWKK